MDDLRKVKFTLEQFNGTIGDYESAGENSENVMKGRTGVFYCWGNEPIFDSVTGTYHDRTIGVVEEYSTGKVYHVIPKLMTF